MGSVIIFPLTLFIIAVIAVLTIVALRSSDARFVNSAPSVLTSFGIFGTFLGITVGLAGFVPGDIAGSIPRLFEGIKLAFWTSVAGILGGILVKLRLLLFPLEVVAGPRATISDMVAALRGVEAGLVDEEKSPLLRSLREFQQQSGDQSAELKKTLDSVAGAMGIAAERDEKILGSLAQMDQRSAAGLAELQASSEAGLKALGEMSEQQADRLVKSLSTDSEKLAERIKAALGQNSSALAKALEGNRDAMAAQITAAVTDLRDALVGPDGAASELGRRMQQGQIDLAAALAKATEGPREAVSQDVGSLTERLAQSSEAASTQVRGVAEAIESLQQAMGGDAAALLERIDNLRSGSEVLGERLGSLLGDRLAALGEDLQGLAENVSSSFGEAAGALSGDLGALNTAIADAIDDLRLAIVGPEGAAKGLADEFRSGQQDTRKALQAIQQALEENTQRQVDYSPKALLGVLEEMVRQFNTQFSGQFWETFEGFNQGIAELLEWMEAYRKQLGDMSEQQARSTKNMDLAARRFDEIASRSEIFIDVSRNMSSLLGGLDAQRVQIESHLKQFAHVVDVTRDNLENIEARIVEGNEETSKHINEISGRIEEQVIRLDTALDEELAKAMNTLGQQLAALSEKFVEDYTPLTERLREVVQLAKKVK